MKSVTIGIYFDGDVRRVEATLAGLGAHTEIACKVVLLPDALDESARAAISVRSIGIPVLEGSVAGAPACFNRLAACNQSELVVFLEAGAVPGPQWLENLLAVLGADPSNGLAGPSTNSAWNEQNALRARGGSLPEVAAAAHEAVARFGNEWRVLEPLHSLSDFCYVVKREVIAAIGGADEQYGLGPCWEMDYSIRAARAGFRGVWACASYVWRPPFSARRARQEPQNLEISKRRYQDKFCGRRLKGQSHGYEPHCRGEDCEHFAPRSCIQIHLPLTPDAGKFGPEVIAAGSPIWRPASTQPLLSCVMVTGNRRDFALQSLRYFQLQDYPNRELIIVDDGAEDLSGDIAPDPKIRYVRVRPGMKIGGKRNRGCELASGTIIAQWDDDDWYGSGRLSAQAQPILSGDADISGLTDSVIFDLPRWRFWTCSRALHRRLFVEDVHGGTLMFRRAVWEKGRYPDVSLAEDAALLRAAVQRGARLRRIPGKGLFVYLRHTSNAWSFECGQYLDPSGWSAVGSPDLGEDLAFYLARASAGPLNAKPGEEQLVSCIMPTADRRAFVLHAIRCFQRQNYPKRELIVLDDGADRVEDLVPRDSSITYLRLNSRHTLGAKRNLACEMARGDLIVHWDDDDWMADWRLAYQVAALADRQQPSACGLSSIYFCHQRGDRAWLYVHPATDGPWIAGGTLCYQKSLWRQHPFQEIGDGEDMRFVYSIPKAAVLPLPDNRFYVATVHDANTSRPKRDQDPRWQTRPASDIQQLMGNRWESFLATLTGAQSLKTRSF
jgi:glycosyltransferase involved in cell wall biosynthesis